MYASNAESDQLLYQDAFKPHLELGEASAHKVSPHHQSRRRSYGWLGGEQLLVHDRPHDVKVRNVHNILYEWVDEALFSGRSLEGEQ